MNIDLHADINIIVDRTNRDKPVHLVVHSQNSSKEKLHLLGKVTHLVNICKWFNRFVNISMYCEYSVYLALYLHIWYHLICPLNDVSHHRQNHISQRSETCQHCWQKAPCNSTRIQSDVDFHVLGYQSHSRITTSLPHFMGRAVSNRSNYSSTPSSCTFICKAVNTTHLAENSLLLLY